MYFYLLQLVVLLIFITLFLICFIIAETIYFFEVRPNLRWYKLIQKIRGPKGHWFIGNSIEIFHTNRDNLLAQVTKWFTNFNVRLRLWLFGIAIVLTRDADDYQVLLSSTEHIKKGLDYMPIRPWLEEGLLTSDGEKWHSRRKMLTPAFHFKILEDNMSIFNKCSRDLINIFMSRKNQEVVIEPYISKCTLQVIMKAAMGLDLDELKSEGEKYIETIKVVSEIFTIRHLTPHYLNRIVFNLLPIGWKFKKNVRFLQQFSMNVINERKVKIQNGSAGTVSSSGKIRKAFLDLMLEYEMKNPGALTDQGLREEVDTFMFEGHDTTSSAIHFTLYSLALYQDIQDKVYTELYDIFGDDDRDITTQDLQKMNYLDKVIKESLRLYPSVPAITRFITKDLVFTDGTIVPERTDIICMIYSLHRNEKYWPDPEKFDPERFLEEKIQGRHPYCYIPFSAGPRNCIGQKFAMMEVKTVVANVVRKLKVLPVTKLNDILLVQQLVLRSATPIKFIFKERNDQ